MSGRCSEGVWVGASVVPWPVSWQVPVPEEGGPPDPDGDPGRPGTMLTSLHLTAPASRYGRTARIGLERRQCVAILAEYRLYWPLRHTA